jgi:rhamnosyl/mannosyltransferase
MKLKILQIYKDYYPPVMGGIEGHLNLLSTRLVEKGHEVHVLVSSIDMRWHSFMQDGVSVTLAPQVGRFFSAPLNYSLPLWIRRHAVGYDLLHFHIPNPTATLAYQMSGVNRPYIATYHADITRQRRLKRLYEASLVQFLTSSSSVIATSDNIVRTSNVLSRLEKKCTVIPLGIDISRFTEGPGLVSQVDEIRRTHRRPTVLFVGKFRHYKGLHVLIEAIRVLDIDLLLIGNGPLEASLKKQVAQAGVSSKVFFLGALKDEDVNAYMKACDIFVLPATQRSEAFGIVQLEAMACGKPIVSTELGTGTSFVNRNGETGIVVPPNDVAALTTAINSLADNQERRHALGHNGRRRLESLFSVEVMMEKTEALYSAVLDDGSKNCG